MNTTHNISHTLIEFINWNTHCNKFEVKKHTKTISKTGILAVKTYKIQNIYKSNTL